MAEPLILTGASSGVGRSLADHLAGDFHVLALARRIDRMKELFDHREYITPYELDLDNLSDVRPTGKELRTDHGPILHLINNAGVNIGGEITDLTVDKILTSVRINAIAPLLLLKGVLPDMEEANFGRVINVTSGAPLNFPKGAAAYTGSKSLLNAFTVTAAKEWSEYNIKINLMSPGPCRTEMAPDGPLDPSACHPTVDHLLTLEEDGPTGRFFWLGYEVPLTPELGDVHWMEGIGSDAMDRVLESDPFRPKAE